MAPYNLDSALNLKINTTLYLFLNEALFTILSIGTGVTFEKHIVFMIAVIVVLVSKKSQTSKRLFICLSERVRVTALFFFKL